MVNISAVLIFLALIILLTTIVQLQSLLNKEKIMFKKFNVSLLLVLAATSSLPLQAADNAGYWLDSTGDMVRNGTGGCWRDMDWSTDNAIAECEGGMKKESDSDSDGIVDSKDACPGTIAGITVDAKGCAKDSDNDGITDSNDRCPGTDSGVSVDANGCANDSDNDGVADSTDSCPDTAAGISVNSTGCAKDSDGDGTADSYDKCPGTVADVKVDATGCAISIDDDNDGIINSLDDCAGTASGTAVNNHGCELKADISLDNVQFKTGTAELSSQSRNLLNAIARILKENKHLNFDVVGHTDNTGDYQSNVKLSESRAKSVRQYLIDQGVSTGRLSAQGYGPDQPVASNDTRQGRSKNRRVELKLK